MDFAVPGFNDSVVSLFHSSAPKEQAIGANVIGEERVSDARRKDFEAHTARFRNYDRALSRYLTNKVISLAVVPATFAASNSGALLPNQPRKTFVRVEQLDWCLDGIGLTRDDFIEKEKAWRLGDVTAAPVIEKFFAEWNDRRDGRPMFAAFLEDVAVHAETPDWAENLRNQLGLGHLDAAANNSILVGQMRYTAEDIVIANGNAGPLFAAPTVLDFYHSPYFHPSPLPDPGKTACGYPIHLADQTDMIREVLHRRIVYQPSHLHAIDVLDSAIPAVDLTQLRLRHLDRLRKVANSPTFGSRMIKPSGSVA